MNSAPRRSVLTWKSFLWHLFVGAVIGLAVGAIPFALPEIYDDPYDIARMGSVGVLIGFLIWFFRAVGESSAPPTARRSADSAKRLPGMTPAPFARRLAQFTGGEEEELNRPRPRPKSKMTFWSLVDFRTWHPPKPAWLIRRILHRIRESVRGPDHRR